MQILLMRNPFSHLDLKQTELAERRAREAHAILRWLAELYVFVLNPRRAIRTRLRMRRIGYDGRRTRRKMRKVEVISRARGSAASAESSRK